MWGEQDVQRRGKSNIIERGINSVIIMREGGEVSSFPYRKRPPPTPTSAPEYYPAAHVKRGFELLKRPGVSGGAVRVAS